MSDLIERLRRMDEYWQHAPLYNEAADRIEQLEGEQEVLLRGYIKVGCHLAISKGKHANAIAEIEQLEAERETWDGHKVCRLLRSDLADAADRIAQLETFTLKLRHNVPHVGLSDLWRTKANEHAKNLRRTRADMLGTEDNDHYLECQRAAAYIEQLEAAIRGTISSLYAELEYKDE